VCESVGFSRLGDWAGWYAGGGANYWLNRRTAIHLGLRAFVPTTNYGCLSSNSRNVCEPGPRVAFLRVGVAFGFGMLRSVLFFVGGERLAVRPHVDR